MTKKHSRLAVTIRAQEADDWADIAAIRGSATVAHHTLQIPYLSRDVVREQLENPPANFHGLVAVVNKVVVGHLGLQIGAGRRAHAASLGMMVHADFQGRGVGTALLQAALDLAENWLNISRIELEVYPDNAVALALYQKFGFVIEGTLRDYAYQAGRFVDTYLMARIREDIG